jgi:hypothetical protein
VVAALSCSTERSGPTQNAGIYEYSGFAALQQQMRTTAADVADRDDCPSGRYVGTWSHDGTEMGGKICSLLTDGSVRVFWSFGSLPVMVAVQGAAGTSGIEAWWEENANCLQR